ncbi:hypothetical protein QEN19_003019 [Hanseniaspora menglaensis]
MTILGVGCDIVYLPRIVRIIQKENNFTRLSLISKKIMHPVEYKKYNELVRLQNVDMIVQYFASIWSIKESLYKSLSYEEQKNISFIKMCRTYYKTNDSAQNNRPLLVGGNFNIKYHLSLSHDTHYVTSYLIREMK